MDLTLCECGHPASGWHHDSYSVCTFDGCGCEEFRPAGAETFAVWPDSPPGELSADAADFYVDGEKVEGRNLFAELDEQVGRSATVRRAVPAPKDSQGPE